MNTIEKRIDLISDITSKSFDTIRVFNLLKCDRYFKKLGCTQPNLSNDKIIHFKLHYKRFRGNVCITLLHENRYLISITNNQWATIKLIRNIQETKIVETIFELLHSIDA
jgi:hypothetical protein